MAEDETDEVPKLPRDARLETLDERLDRLQQEEAKRTAQRGPDASYRAGQLVLSYLIGGPVAGFLIGFALVRWFGAKPWVMILTLFLGFAGGVWNVIRISNNPPGSTPGGQG